MWVVSGSQVKSVARQGNLVTQVIIIGIVKMKEACSLHACTFCRPVCSCFNFQSAAAPSLNICSRATANNNVIHYTTTKPHLLIWNQHYKEKETKQKLLGRNHATDRNREKKSKPTSKMELEAYNSKLWSFSDSLKNMQFANNAKPLKTQRGARAAAFKTCLVDLLLLRYISNFINSLRWPYVWTALLKTTFLPIAKPNDAVKTACGFKLLGRIVSIDQ